MANPFKIISSPIGRVTSTEKLPHALLEINGKNKLKTNQENSSTTIKQRSSKSFLDMRIGVIAELGTSHMGSLSKVKESIDACKHAGANAVKLQIVFADEILHSSTKPFLLEGKKVDLLQKFRSLERNRKFYEDAQSYAKKCGIVLMASFFGLRSYLISRSLGFPVNKLASPESHHLGLWEALRRNNTPLLVSLGVTKASDVRWLAQYVKQLSMHEQVAFLHCLTRYPAPEEEYDLATIFSLMNRYRVPCGLSCHGGHPFFLPVLAASLFAWRYYGGLNLPLHNVKENEKLWCSNTFILEKHVALPGKHLDDAVAITPKELKELIQQMHFGAVAVAEIIKNVQEHDGETNFAEWMQFFTHMFGYSKDRVAAALGTGVKKLAASEAGFYQTTNRSFLAKRSIEENEKIGFNNVVYLRSESGKIPGLSYRFYRELLAGKTFTAIRTISSGEAITKGCVRRV